MISNEYIRTRVQKGFIEGVAGCVEHTTTQWEMLQDAKKHQRNICMAWLDLENAYGSVRHMLIQFALKWYYVPNKILELVFRYYDGIFLSVVTDEWQSDPFHLGIGVPQGCTASTIMFDVAFQVVSDIWTVRTRSFDPGYRFSGNYPISISCPTYADDVALVATTASHCQKSIDAFERALDWTETLKIKPSKCRSLGFRRFTKADTSGFKKIQSSQYSCFDPLLKVKNGPIKFVGEDDPPMFKYLGRYVQYDLKEDRVKLLVEDKLLGWLERVDKAALEGRMKAWIVNFHVCSKLSWLLMVQNFSETTVQKWQTMIHRRYRKWIGLAKPTEPSVLYRSNEHFGLNFKELPQMQKRLQVIKWYIMKKSNDSESRLVYQRRLELDKKGEIGQGRKTSPSLNLECHERAAALDSLAKGQQGRSGLGHRGLKRKWKPDNPRTDILDQMKAQAEELRLQALHGYQMQTSWLSWGLNGMMKKDLSWNAILYQYSQRLLKFLVNVQANTLPSPDNLRRWHLNKNSEKDNKNFRCGLCGEEKATLGHILAGCTWVRTTENKLPNNEDRYKWRHNNVLAVIAEVIQKLVSRPQTRKAPETKREFKSSMPLIKFVKAGQKARRSRLLAVSPRTSSGISADIGAAQDWECHFDLPESMDLIGGYSLPQKVWVTSQLVDGYLLSEKTKCCVLIELTCPMEENIAKWHKEKLEKYSALCREAEEQGWKIHFLAVEVGARGWIPSGTAAQLRALGLNPEQTKTLCKRLSMIALKSSYVIWLNRFHFEFPKWRIRD